MRSHDETRMGDFWIFPSAAKIKVRKVKMFNDANNLQKPSLVKDTRSTIVCIFTILLSMIF